MKQYHVALRVCEEENPDRSWDEKFDNVVCEDPHQWANDTLKKFNDTLRPGEKARRILSIEASENDLAHAWVKTSFMLIEGTHHYKGWKYDTYKCAKCGITGKRGALSPVIKRDPPYKARKYAKCQPPQ